MKNEEKKLDQLKGKNPFTVPEGYMENLTTQIMSQLPEKEIQPKEATKINMMTRMRPWLYMAAVFVGLLLFFKGIVGITGKEDTSNDSLLVHTDIPQDAQQLMYGDELYDEDEEYLEYLENTYTNYILAEELGFSE